ncbi:MAG TPA: hypothetical protein VGB07_27830, partial [Blastocatellia bacterium]
SIVNAWSFTVRRLEPRHFRRGSSARRILYIKLGSRLGGLSTVKKSLMAATAPATIRARKSPISRACQSSANTFFHQASREHHHKTRAVVCQRRALRELKPRRRSLTASFIHIILRSFA